VRRLVTWLAGENNGQPQVTPVEQTPVRLDRTERRQLDGIRRFGTVGSLLMACGGLGAGASPVINPLPGVPILGLFPRIPTVAIASAFTGMVMVVLAWLWLGRLVWPGRPRVLSRAQMDRTLVMWTVPLILVPPMFSQDVYSYLAQSAVIQHGGDPYTNGAANTLGPDNPLAQNVPTIWRSTPSPYGPLFLTVGRLVNSIAGNNVVIGVLLERLLMLVGLGLIVWALPRLARRFGIPPISAIWLGAANPLVLFHLVVGVHNEALAIGLMMAGMVVALNWLPMVEPGERIPPLGRHELLGIIAGSTLITLGAGIKILALVALGFLGVIIARRWGGTITHLVKTAAAMAVVAVVVTTAITLASGLGWGWMSTLNGGTIVLSWLSPVTLTGMAASALGIVLQLGNHTNAIVGTVRALGWLAFAATSAVVLWRSFRGRYSAMYGLGLVLIAFVVLGPVVQPWYLLWPIIPLSTAVASPKFRLWATVACALVAIITPPTGTGFDGRVFVLPQSIAAALVLSLLLLLLVRGQLPAREPRGSAAAVRTVTTEPTA
jgi:alpha-1,6-mannosyltransferase